mmetsp:Transcript_108730/g.306410  ORF Transcript_108730/g.306410 Transcript_108730/m.306410 type:complete len:226 (+) Transcript_108730:69-746(+)
MAELPGGHANTYLEPFLRGLAERPFQEEVQSFLRQHAAEFAVACPDGSYPLRWTELHHQYRQMFDRQLAAVVQEEGFSRDDFRDYCDEQASIARQLRHDDLLPCCPGVRVADFWEFLRALTASEDFDRFLQVMFARVVELSRAATAAADANCDDGRQPLLPGPTTQDTVAQATQELEVVVPDGLCPGQVLAVDYLGVRYELTVPDGYWPGSVFRAAVALPGHVPA